MQPQQVPAGRSGNAKLDTTSVAPSSIVHLVFESTAPEPTNDADTVHRPGRPVAADHRTSTWPIDSKTYGLLPTATVMLGEGGGGGGGESGNFWKQRVALQDGSPPHAGLLATEPVLKQQVVRLWPTAPPSFWLGYNVKPRHVATGVAACKASHTQRPLARATSWLAQLGSQSLG